jgi:hypothetical protein
MTGQPGGRNEPESRTPVSFREVQPGALALFWATFAAVCLLLSLGTANDMGIDNPGLLLGGAVLVGCVAGVVWSLRRPRRSAARWKAMSRRTQLSLSLGIVLPMLGLIRAAQGAWGELTVMLCVWLICAIGMLAEAVHALAPGLLALWRSRASPRPGYVI